MSSWLIHTKNILMTLFTTLLLIGLGLLSVWPIAAPLPKIFVNQFVIQPASYSVTLSNLQTPDSFYKISPFDDAIVYSDGSRQKLLPADNALTNDYLKDSLNLLKRVDFVWQEILKKPQVKFTQQKDPNRLQIAYRVRKDQSLDAILVNKQIGNLRQEAMGFVDAFGFSNDDFVIDSNGILYTRQNDIELLQKILKDGQDDCDRKENGGHFCGDRNQNVHTQKINTNRVVTEGIEFFTIINPSTVGHIVIFVLPEQKVTLDKNYRLIEVETDFLKSVSEINHEQIIYFAK